MRDLVTACDETRSGYRVTINETITFHLSPADYRALPLHAGDPVDWETYRHDLLLRQYPDALQRAVAMLAARAHSRREVERKLADRGYIAEAIEMVVFKLEKEGLLDDEAFAHARASAGIHRGLGKARIQQELRMKGVAEPLVQDALARLDAEDQQAQALRLAQKVLKHYAKYPPREAVQKAVASMLRRGYAYGDASRAIQAALRQDAET